MPRVNNRSTLFDFDTSVLMPCPFCGFIAKDEDGERCFLTKDYTNGHDWHYFVECFNCGCEPKFYVPTIEEAVLKWNTRPQLRPGDEFKLGYEAAKNDLVKAIMKDLKAQWKEADAAE